MPRLLAAFGLALLILTGGCGGEEQKEETVKISAPINNQAPEAANAPAAPVDPSIQYPGKMKQRGK